MSENSKAVRVLAEFVKDTVLNMTKKLSYDKSVRAKIVGILGNNKYEVKYGGESYFPTSLNGAIYEVGDRVIVTFPQSIIEYGFIVGKVG